MSRYDGNLAFVRDFLSRLVDNMTANSHPREIGGDYFWFRQDGGMLTLDSNEYRDYQKVLEQLTEKLAPTGDLSQSTIDSALQDAMFAVLSVQTLGDGDNNTRVSKAVRTLRELPDRTSEPFECLLEVRGLDKNSLPSSFGRIRFVIFNKYQRRKLYKKFKPEQHALCDSTADRLMDSCLGVVTCSARDVKAATILARREVQATVECLNFFSDFVPYNHSWLFLPGELETTVIRKIAVGEHGTFTLESSRVGPMGGYAIGKLRSRKNINKAVKRIDRLLQAQTNPVEDLLLRSVRWAGRATVAPLREEAFMLYTIALESVVLPGADHGELSHRLSQRVAKLTADTVTERGALQTRTKKLYGVRSEIVHSGLYEVSEGDLGLIGSITKRVIFKLLADSTVAGLTKTDELEQWYEQRMLEG